MAWWNQNFPYRLPITASGQGEDLIDFPVLVKLSSSRFNYVAAATSSGTDIRFATTEGDRLLDFEVEKWVSGSDSFIWVKVPKIASGVSTGFYLYYGAPASGNAQNKTGVWSNQYEAVYHFGETTGMYQDSTQNVHHSDTGVFNRNLGTGNLIGNSVDFDGTFGTYVHIPDSNGFDLTGYTIEALIISSGAGQVPGAGTGNGGIGQIYPIITKGMAETETQAADIQFFLGQINNDTIGFDFENNRALGGQSENFPTSGATALIVDGQVSYHIAAVVSGKTFTKLYLDGKLDASGSITGIPSTGGSQKVGIGTATRTGTVPTGGFRGLIDEVRISKVPRTSGWMNATSLSARDTLLIFGDNEPFPGTRMNQLGLSCVVDPNGVYIIDNSGDFLIDQSGDFIVSQQTATTVKNQQGLGRITISWWDAAWSYRRYLVVSGNPNEVLTDFPVLIKLDSTRIGYAHVANTSGHDLRFLTLDNQRILDYETEKWVSGGNSFLWVKIPVLPSGSTTGIFMYYGNASAPNGQNRTGVWSNQYEAVLHFGEQVNNYSDSTKFGHDSDAVVSVGRDSTSLIGNAASFNGSETTYVTLPDSSGFDLKSYTIEAFVMSSGIGSSHSAGTGGGGFGTIYPIITKGGPETETQADDIQFFMGQTPSSNLGFDFENNRAEGGTSQNFPVTGASVLNSGGTVSYHVAAAVSGSGFTKLYVDGIQDASVSHTFTPSTGGNQKVGIGADTRNSAPQITGGFRGLIDEVRISRTVRTSGWLNQSSKSVKDQLVSFSSEITGLVPFSQLQSGKAAVSNTVAQSQSGVSTIYGFGGAEVSWAVFTAPAPFYDYNQSGVAKIGNTLITGYQNQSGLGAIKATKDANETGQAKITATIDRTESGLGKIQVTNSGSQTGRGYIKGLILRDQSGKAAIFNTVNQNISGKSRLIHGSFYYARNDGAARLSKQAGTSPIYDFIDAPEGPISSPGLSLWQGATPALTGVTLTSSDEAVVNVVAFYNGANPDVSLRVRILRESDSSVVYDLSQKSLVHNSPEVHSWRLQPTGNSTVITNGDRLRLQVLVNDGTGTATANGAVIRIETDQPATDSFTWVQFPFNSPEPTIQNQLGVADIKRSIDRTESGISFINYQNFRNESGVAKIKQTYEYSESGISKVSAVVTKTQAGVADIFNSISRNLSGVATIFNFVDRNQQGISFVLPTGLFSIDRDQSGVMFILTPSINMRPYPIVIKLNTTVNPNKVIL